MRFCVLAISLLVGGCAGFMTYAHDTDLQVVMVDDKPAKDTRSVPRAKEEPIGPTPMGQWFIPSGWAVALATRWADLPFAFQADGPEYCTALGVDNNRMLHVSVVVRYRDRRRALTECPNLVWTGNEFMICLGSCHSHQTLTSHGERASSHDATLGSPVPVLAAGTDNIEMLRVAVQFSSGKRLMGIDPATGKEAPVPAQSLLLTRFDGRVHVFLWIPLAEEKEGKSNFIRVYRPAANDKWEEAGTCWIDLNDIRRAAAINAEPPVRCDPEDFWLK